MKAKLAAISKFCVENEGAFSLVSHGGHWSSICSAVVAGTGW
jgi:hypothetical protein